MTVFLVRILGPLFLAAWTTVVWGGNPAWLLIGAALGGIVVLCAPVCTQAVDGAGGAG